MMNGNWVSMTKSALWFMPSYGIIIDHHQVQPSVVSGISDALWMDLKLFYTLLSQDSSLALTRDKILSYSLVKLKTYTLCLRHIV